MFFVHIFSFNFIHTVYYQITKSLVVESIIYGFSDNFTNKHRFKRVYCLMKIINTNFLIFQRRDV